MSLNHLVTGGQAPPQDITVNNLNVEGTITGGSTSGTFDNPTTTVTSTGSGAGLVDAGHMHYSALGDVYTIGGTMTFNSGTLARTAVVTIEAPPNLTNADRIRLVVNCTHQNIGGEYENLVLGTIGFTPGYTNFQFSLNYELAGDFPINKEFRLSYMGQFQNNAF